MTADQSERDSARDGDSSAIRRIEIRVNESLHVSKIAAERADTAVAQAAEAAANVRVVQLEVRDMRYAVIGGNPLLPRDAGALGRLAEKMDSFIESHDRAADAETAVRRDDDHNSRYLRLVAAGLAITSAGVLVSLILGLLHL